MDLSEVSFEQNLMKMKVKKGAVQRREGKGIPRTSAKTMGW